MAWPLIAAAIASSVSKANSGQAVGQGAAQGGAQPVDTSGFQSKPAIQQQQMFPQQQYTPVQSQPQAAQPQSGGFAQFLQGVQGAQQGYQSGGLFGILSQLMSSGGK